MIIIITVSILEQLLSVHYYYHYYNLYHYHHLCKKNIFLYDCLHLIHNQQACRKFAISMLDAYF